METAYKVIIALAVIALFAIGGVVAFIATLAPPTQKVYVISYYYGDGCEHCEKVSDYISNNSALSPITITKKEVSHDADNYAELRDVGRLCGYANNSIGVPMFFIDNECYMGPTQIINFLESKKIKK